MEHFADNFDVDRLGRRRKTCRDCKVRRERSGFMTRVRTQLAENGLTPETLNEYKYAGGDGANGGNLRHLHYYELVRPGEDFPEHVDHCEICDHFIDENCYLEHKERGSIELVVGNCCIKRFVDDSGRTCRNCGAEHRSRTHNLCKECVNANRIAAATCDTCGARHRNRVVNRCKGCREHKCDKCGGAKTSHRTTCDSCHYGKGAQPEPAAVPPPLVL
jgi:hypothetical protein